jgi:hypothetical protein
VPPVQIPWPTSALPGRRPGDGQGDLINAYAVKIGDLVEIRRTPGLVRRLTLPDTTARFARGMHSIPNRLYHAWDEEIRMIGPTGTDVPVTGALPGIDRVTMAHNMRDGWPNLAVVTDLATYLLDVETNTIAAYPDPLGNLNLHGQPNSVEYFSGYFVFTKASGYFAVSDLQNPDIPDGSYGKTEYTADVLLRAKGMQNVLFLFSDKSTEAWVDVATLPMPFTRQTSLDVGLLGRWAIAGGSNEWERGLYFVAADYTVRSMEGMTPKIISNDDVAFDIYGYRDLPDAIVAQVYTFEQQAVVSISTPDWTWEYNVSSGSWHRRDSYGLPYWRATSATQHNARWYAQDLIDARIFEIAQEVFSEDGERLRFRCESGPMKQFPASMRFPSIDIDCIVALGKTRVPSPFETNPAMEISWSHDGGANWSRPVTRSMGREGRFANKVTVNNLGRSTHHGTRIRVDVVDPVPATITGGVSTKVKPSRPRQVNK